MSSAQKIEANRRNAQASTGPRTPEGKSAVAVNAVTHGLRAKKTVLRYYENSDEFHQLCTDLHQEWQPVTTTEANLVEQMAIAQFKLVRLEAMLSSSFYQSYLQRLAKSGEILDDKGNVRPCDVVTDREAGAQRLTNGVSQHIVRVERAWYKALTTLQRLQDRRQLAGAADSTPVQERQTPSGRSATAQPHIVNSKNDNQSHRWEGTDSANEGSAAASPVTQQSSNPG